ncbi:MAG: sugar phosphate isomerase/epimerase [Sedimentisphaerales bacterium]|nr:sugar phosphate isomerase/epimerase [Sedimentisphaerales bacterium]
MNTKVLSRRRFLTLSASGPFAASLASGLTAGLMSRSAAAEDGAPKKLSKGVIIGMLPRDLSDAEKFQLAKRCGFEGIEASPLDSLDAARRQGELARQIGTPIHSVLFGWWPPFTDTSAATIDECLKKMTNALQCAQAMQAGAVLLVPTRVTENFRYADAYKRSQDYIRRLIPVAEETRVVIAVENVWNKFLLSPLEFARYIDEFESPWVRAYFDVGNVIIYGFSQDWIRTLGKRIARIHLKDFQRNGYQWKNLLEGDVNWPEVRKSLDEIGYAGWLTAELSGGSEQALTDIAGRMDRIIAGSFG